LSILSEFIFRSARQEIFYLKAERLCKIAVHGIFNYMHP